MSKNNLDFVHCVNHNMEYRSCTEIYDFYICTDCHTLQKRKKGTDIIIESGHHETRD